MKNSIAKLQSYYDGFFKSSSLRKGITKVYGGDVLSNVVSAATALLIIRGFSVDDYAAYTAFYGILMLIPGLVGNGINLALVRFSSEHISRTGEKPSELYFVSFVFQFVLYLTCCAVVLVFSDRVTNILFGQKSFDSALRYGLIAGMGFLISQAGRGVYNAEEKFGHYIKVLWLRQFLVLLVISILFLLRGLTFELIAQIIILVELSIAGIITFLIFRNTNIRKIISDLKKQSGIIKKFILSTGWLIAYLFILTAFQRFDIFMLSHFSSEKELANYGVAFRYYSIALLALSSIHAVLLPKFSKIDMQDFNKQHQFTIKWLKTTIWIIVPILIVDIFGKSLFVWVNGQQYEKAFYMFVIFSLGVWLSLMLSPLVNILIARNAFRFMFLLGLSAFIFNFIGNYIFIPLWGGIGAAIITIMSHLLINFGSFIKVFITRNKYII